MKTLKICLVILCLLHVRAVGLTQFSGANFFMGKYVDLTGLVYGNVTILKKLDKRNSSGSIYWQCECKCGKVFETITQVIKGGINSCGCEQRIAFVKSHIGKPSSNIKPHGVSNSRIVYRSYKDNARRHGREFSITYEEFVRLTSKNCHYCGAEPSQIIRARYANCNGVYKYNGLDRVDNNIGYVLNNLLPCCKTCNRAKYKMSYDEFKSWIISASKYIQQ